MYREQQSMSKRIKKLKTRHPDPECLSVIDDLVKLLGAASDGIVDICRVVSAPGPRKPLKLKDRKRVLEMCLETVCAASMEPV